MKTLLQFFVRNYLLLLFLLLETVALTFVFSHNEFQHSAFLSSANRVSATMYAVESDITSYFSLHSQNEILAEENLRLRSQINDLQNRLEAVVADSLTYTFPEKDITYLSASLVHLSANPHRNYITINRGRRDGVMPDMGVCCAQGVVGIVNASSERYATVIPILNDRLTISSKFKKNNQAGTLHWQGGDYRFANLQDIARHISVSEGDTIVTSGLSAIFPADLPVGTVETVTLKESDEYYSIRVRLAVDFRSLSNVYVIRQNNSEELQQIEEEGMK